MVNEGRKVVFVVIAIMFANTCFSDDIDELKTEVGDLKQSIYKCTLWPWAMGMFLSNNMFQRVFVELANEHNIPLRLQSSVQELVEEYVGSQDIVSLLILSAMSFHVASEESRGTITRHMNNLNQLITFAAIRHQGETTSVLSLFTWVNESLTSLPEDELNRYIEECRQVLSTVGQRQRETPENTGSAMASVFQTLFFAVSARIQTYLNPGSH